MVNKETTHYNLRLIMIGNPGVGMTSLFHMYAFRHCFEHYYTLICEPYEVSVTIEGKNALIKIFEHTIYHSTYRRDDDFQDTSLNQQYEAFAEYHLNDFDACALIFSLSSRDSFVDLKNKKKRLDNILGEDLNNYPFIVVGNKSDEQESRVVNRFEVEDWCKKEGICTYFETSAKTGYNVNEAFGELAHFALAHQESREKEYKKSICEKLSKRDNASSSNCVII
ncbi:Rab7L1, Rab7-like protein [Monocercomonoides exilis]|uniref:Rab7L1, Rab7-like protein n=1 Tax=Monocercomonoides exilis TaxID=2049356 RepID=UPI00355AC42A|nr:Rab7L1, Rab7-like protein [Monocercomonoides exilis]|eukprot:MONOS_16766.1-p1 / transcript=MONOS_16766.1 / gene=MONOS_16766 / organism=Monocercomonoides_exilis_PA203 / gene_product=Rab7L1, Rab7-like protein / transcript_product=Rab7L1, Rab7-like protein / location=Mono_scaffold00581:3558-4229(+) / protein_length=224 / sequence_SO=supercontig / SO=protein_coding / is_pseudo=false